MAKQTNLTEFGFVFKQLKILNFATNNEQQEELKMSHTFGNMLRDREDKIRDNMSKQRLKKEKEAKEFEEKMKDKKFKLNYELGQTKSRIIACKWDIEHGFVSKQSEYNTLVEKQKRIEDELSKL